MDKKLETCLVFGNGAVVVTNAKGEQVPELSTFVQNLLVEKFTSLGYDIHGLEIHLPNLTVVRPDHPVKLPVKNSHEAAGADPSIASRVSLCVSERTPEELALGWLRYEAVRKMNPRQFGEVCRRNLGGEFFDGIVTEAVLGVVPATKPDEEVKRGPAPGQAEWDSPFRMLGK